MFSNTGSRPPDANEEVCLERVIGKVTTRPRAGVYLSHVPEKSDWMTEVSGRGVERVRRRITKRALYSCPYAVRAVMAAVTCVYVLSAFGDEHLK